MMNLERYLSWFDHVEIGVYFVDCHREIRYFNQAAEQITGFSSREINGSFCQNNLFNHVSLEGVALCLQGCPLLDSITRNVINEADVFLQHKAGHRLKVHVKTLPVLEAGEVVGALEIFTPHNEKNILHQALKYYQKQALTDSLTALNNRAVLKETVPNMIHQSPEHIAFGIIFADIDNFKSFNDTYGHDLGDQVLVTLSKTLSHTVKNTDVVIRYGGEEFLIIVYDVSEQSLHEQAEQIRVVVAAASLREENRHHRFTISLGATVLARDEPLAAAIERADKGMYESKKNGKNRVTLVR